MIHVSNIVETSLLNRFNKTIEIFRWTMVHNSKKAIFCSNGSLLFSSTLHVCNNFYQFQWDVTEEGKAMLDKLYKSRSKRFLKEQWQRCRRQQAPGAQFAFYHMKSFNNLHAKVSTTFTRRCEFPHTLSRHCGSHLVLIAHQATSTEGNVHYSNEKLFFLANQRLSTSVTYSEKC